jgi:hypothetical protein
MFRKESAGEMLQGTLDMLILRTLVTGPAHGHTIAQVIEHTSKNALEVEQGSLYPALHRWKIGDCFPQRGESARTIARRSFISSPQKAGNISAPLPAVGER